MYSHSIQGKEQEGDLIWEIAQNKYPHALFLYPTTQDQFFKGEETQGIEMLRIYSRMAEQKKGETRTTPIRMGWTPYAPYKHPETSNPERDSTLEAFLEDKMHILAMLASGRYKQIVYNAYTGPVDSFGLLSTPNMRLRGAPQKIDRRMLIKWRELFSSIHGSTPEEIRTRMIAEYDERRLMQKPHGQEAESQDKNAFFPVKNIQIVDIDKSKWIWKPTDEHLKAHARLALKLVNEYTA